MGMTEKAAYIKGLAEGLELDKETKEGKIIAALLDLVDEMAKEIADIKQDIEEIDEDLNYLDEEYEEDEEWDEECDGDCVNCDGCDCEDDEFCEIVCPSCGETVCFDCELDPENLLCPACGEKFGCIVEEDDYKAISEEE